MNPNDLQMKIKFSNEVIKEAFNKFSHNDIFLSFNGGKDCTVLLHLLLSNIQTTNKKLNCIYIQPEKPFEEIEDFVKQCDNLYDIHIREFRGNIKSALESICREMPNVKACIMGSRRSDPYCSKLDYFQETDPGWPKLMRINPLLDWNCTNIWDYIQNNKIPYCSLYNKGYTSLGDKTNTIQNPYLKYVDAETNSIKYNPAYMLKDADKYEREGRF